MCGEYVASDTVVDMLHLLTSPTSSLEMRCFCLHPPAIQWPLPQQHMTSPGLEHALLVGGTDARRAAKLVKEPCDVIVGTPGRVLDFIEKGILKTTAIRLLVICGNPSHFDDSQQFSSGSKLLQVTMVDD